MKIRIREFRGKRACAGFYPKAGVRLTPGKEYEYGDGEEAEFEAALATGFVEEVRSGPGGPRKNAQG